MPPSRRALVRAAMHRMPCPRCGVPALLSSLLRPSRARCMRCGLKVHRHARIGWRRGAHQVEFAMTRWRALSGDQAHRA